ncbi:MAG: (deoxy)nucleoside triphosphate pyrophosphohydrolase [Syntrophomonadales bacterium]
MVKDVTAAIIIRDNRVLITRRARNQKLAGKWEFPGGKIEKGESPEGCLIRELEEELGIRVLVGQKFGVSQYRYEHGEIRLLAYYADIISGTVTLSVHDAYSWESPHNLLSYDFSPADIPLVKKLVHIAEGRS